MFHHKSWKLVYFGGKRSKVKVASQKKLYVGFQTERARDL